MSIKQVVEDLIAPIKGEFADGEADRYRAVAQQQLDMWLNALQGKKPHVSDKRKDGTWKDEAPVYVTHINPEGEEVGQGVVQKTIGFHQGYSKPPYAWDDKAKIPWYVDQIKCESDSCKSSQNALGYLAEKMRRRISDTVGRRKFEIEGQFTRNEHSNSIEGRFTVTLNNESNESKFDLVVALTTEWSYNKPLYRFPIRFENVVIDGQPVEGQKSSSWMKENF